MQICTGYARDHVRHSATAGLSGMPIHGTARGSQAAASPFGHVATLNKSRRGRASSSSDTYGGSPSVATHALLALYDRLGPTPDLLLQLAGQYAFVLYDDQRGAAFAARSAVPGVCLCCWGGVRSHHHGRLIGGLVG